MEKQNLNGDVVSSQLTELVAEELQQVEERGRELQQLRELLEGNLHMKHNIITNFQYTAEVSNLFRL